MARHGDNILKRTGKKLSVLVFETTKRSRIMKKRMRIGTLQKALKADYRDLGFVVFDAVNSGRGENLLEEPDVKALISRISKTQHEIERLREGVARIARARKSFGIPGSLLAIEAIGSAPGSDVGIAPDTAPPVKKRAFFGLGKSKKEKAIEALRKAVSSEAGSGPLTGMEKTADETGEGKPRRSLFGIGRKKEGHAFLGLGRKKDLPGPSADLPPTPPSPPSGGQEEGTKAAPKKKPAKPKKVSPPTAPRPAKKAKSKPND